VPVWVVGCYRDVLLQDLEVVEGRRALGEFVRVAQHLVDAVRLQAELLGARDLRTAVWVNADFAYVRDGDVQTAIPVDGPHAAAVHRENHIVGHLLGVSTPTGPGPSPSGT